MSGHSLKTRPDPPLERQLVLMLCCLECEVVLLVQIEELFPVAGRKVVPIADSHAETTFFGIAQRIHKGLDREIVPDSVALNRAARPADIDGFAIYVCSGHREPYLAPTECRKIGLSCEAKRNTVAVCITDVDKSPSPIKGQGLEPHPVVFRAERAFIGIENDIQIPLLLIDFPVVVHDLTRVFRRLIDFAADIKGQQPGARLFIVGARLDIGMEGYDIAPVCRDLEYVDNAAEGIIEDSVDIHMHHVVSLKRLQIERKAEAVSLHSGHVPVIGVEQDVFALPKLFDS